MDRDPLRPLARKIAERLAGLVLSPPEVVPADYDQVFARIARKASSLEKQVARNRARVEARYRDLIDQPPGRQATVIRNSSPTFLIALAHVLMKASYAGRFDSIEQTLSMAALANQAAVAVRDSGHLSEATAADLEAETLCYLGNALRLNCDLDGAERALAKARILLRRGTLDRALKADHLSFLATLRQTQGLAQKAASLHKKEIVLRRLYGEPERLGSALINCGITTCYADGDLLEAARMIQEGTELVEDHHSIFLGLFQLAEAFARAGKGADAWQLLCTSDLLDMVADFGPGLRRRQRWIKGVAFRSLGENSYAARLLSEVRDEFIECGQPLSAAYASLDLLTVLAADDRHREMIPIAEATHRVFVAEKLEPKALGAFLILHRAVHAKTLSEELALRVATFITRRQHDREARFE